MILSILPFIWTIAAKFISIRIKMRICPSCFYHHAVVNSSIGLTIIKPIRFKVFNTLYYMDIKDELIFYIKLIYIIGTFKYRTAYPISIHFEKLNRVLRIRNRYCDDRPFISPILEEHFENSSSILVNFNLNLSIISKK